MTRRDREPGRCGLLAAALLALGACGGGEAPEPSFGVPRRLVSMAPSATEIVFALGLGQRLVGVTRFCDYPPAAAALPRLGGYLDPNYEAIVGLEPDLVLLIQDHADLRRRLEELGLPTLVLDHHDVRGILDSIRTVASACGVPERGHELAAQLEARLHAVEARVEDLPRPRVLVVVGRDAGTGRVASVWVAGPSSYYDDVVRLAGGVNACSSDVAAYPELSREGLLHIDPDVILDVVPAVERDGLDPARARADWDHLTELSALRAGRIHVLGQDLMEIPGPRIAEAVEMVARVLHPAAFSVTP